MLEIILLFVAVGSIVTATITIIVAKIFKDKINSLEKELSQKKCKRKYINERTGTDK